MDGKTLMFDQPESGEERVITIGRRDTCDIHMSFDNQVSRLHAKLGCTYQPVTETNETSAPAILQFWLEDCHSRNGTFVEKLPERIEERIQLRPGTLFRIGRTWLRLDVPLSIGR